jgi:hypothetical protein
MLEKMDERVKRMGVLDIGLTKLSVFFFTLIIVKLFPELANISYRLLLVFALLCAVKPLYAYFIKK